MRPVVSVAGFSVRGGLARATQRALPEETAVAMVYGGSTQAVMMASPADLEDLAVGFSLSERVVAHAGEIETLEIVEQEAGIELRMWLRGDRSTALARRRRFMAGPVGCGLCGIDSLEEALRPLPAAAAGGLALGAAEVEAAVASIGAWQPLHDRTRAAHAAAFWHPEAGIVLAREDVGRHNALDKLVGALARGGGDAAGGAILLTSRVRSRWCRRARSPRHRC